jgi:type VI protein secretion system component VasF
MALSMEEERILTEIASQLSEDDPALARRLARFGRARRPPRRGGRARLVVAVVLAAAVVAAAVAVTVVIAAA